VPQSGKYKIRANSQNNSDIREIIFNLETPNFSAM